MNLLYINEDNLCTIESNTKIKPSASVIGDASQHDVPVPQSAAATAAAEGPLTKETIVQQYADLFTGAGRLEGEVHLEVNPTVPPVQQRWAQLAMFLIN